MGLSRHFEELVKSLRDANGHARQSLSYDRMVETQDIATDNLAKALIDIRRNTRAHQFKVAKPKTEKSSRRKIMSDYYGDESLLCDKARGKLIVDSPKQIEALQDKLPELLEAHGMFVVQESDYFEKPKARTGYSCLNYKIAVPVGEDADGKTEYQISELQVVAKQIEAVSKQSHYFKRQAENLIADGLKTPEDRKMAWAYSTIARGITAKVRLDHGYEALLKTPERDGLTQTRMQKYRNARETLMELVKDRDIVDQYVSDAALDRKADDLLYTYGMKTGQGGAEFYRFIAQDDDSPANLERFSEINQKWVEASPAEALMQSRNFQVLGDRFAFCAARVKKLSEFPNASDMPRVKELKRHLEGVDFD